MNHPLRSVLISAAALSFTMIGCSTQIDHAKVEDSIRTELKAKGVTMTELTCPANIVAKEGGTFTCNGTDDEKTSTTFTVTMTDTQGSITWKLDGTIIDMKTAGDGLEAALASNLGKKVDVKCPAKAMIAKTGCAFTCDVAVEGEAHKLAVTCKDNDGNVTGKIE